ncbi:MULTISPECIES: ATP-binding response regulator [Planktothricoides]|uniref:histidine kinase n=2 Tax=Planktothricoides raciborskii TaxID=132608 RepID=A0AAU8J958_9CYAN|nr:MULTISPECIES: response regulator [Planktothricoides]KOR37482.1 response regulator receiver protein [Planktothricoides sp. SR001]MBD2543076.1 response regulator [Planktothricoides raciborskii FACHB-1370]MBD2581955.1 response regulator [Planktothricoides raciborskii FACHB-1261]
MKKILVIEDEKPVLTNIIEILESGGFRAIGAENGEIGVQLATQEIPDLIICDIMMPVLDGYGVLTKLRSQPLTEIIPFIFLTAKADKGDLRQGMNLGADDYISKPFRRKELLEAVNIRLEKQAAVMQKYISQFQRAEGLLSKMQDLQQLSETKEGLLMKLISDLRDPLSKINLAIKMLKNTPPGASRDRYLEILQEEFDKEIALLNQVSDVQELLTLDNVKLLRQFNLIEAKSIMKSDKKLY